MDATRQRSRGCQPPLGWGTPAAATAAALLVVCCCCCCHRAVFASAPPPPPPPCFRAGRRALSARACLLCVLQMEACEGSLVVRRLVELLHKP